MRLILEQRYLFDASLVRAAGAARASTPDRTVSDHAGDGKVDMGSKEALAVPAAARDGEHVNQAEHGIGNLASTPASGPQRYAAGAQGDAPVDAIVFIDPRVSNWRTLADGAKADVAVFVVDASKDGLAQVTQVLSQSHGIASVSFLTYGEPGKASLGASAVTSDAILSNATMISSWRDHLTDNAEIAFWGCDVGAGQVGQSFVDDLHAVTGLTVAASTHAIGSSLEHGNWTLDRIDGAEGVIMPFSMTSTDTYTTVLDRPAPTVAFDAATVPLSALLGSTFTESVTFTNTALNGVGYAPFIDVFGPSNPAERVTLNSAMFLGSALTVTPVTLSMTVTGHAGVLGALHPLATDGTGAPLFVAAPSGYVTGDTLYVIKLPFGSFTPGQPSARVDLSLTVDARSELTASHPGAGLNLAAIGGFALGADALNNPTTDLSIRGTNTSASPGTSDASNGAVANSSTVDLMKFSAVVKTNPGENENATGASQPLNYTVTVTPATAVTASNPITSLDVTVVLPDTVRYTGGTITVANGGTATFTANPSGADGGTVKVTYASLSAATNVIIPVYVPQLDNTGAPILDAVTGAPRTSTAPISTYGNGTWTPVSGSLDFGIPQAVSGSDISAPSFVEKSLAVQEAVQDVTSGGSIIPGDTLQYSVSFQVSDYFGVRDINLQSVLGDGLTLLPGTAPVLTVNSSAGTQTVNFGAVAGTSATVNGQVVATSGSGAFWNYSRDNTTTGRTNMSFDIGGALTAAYGSSVVQGSASGARGTITFRATVLDKYTNTNIDPFTSKPGSITERDGVATSVSATANLLNAAGVQTNTPYSVVSDNSATSVSVVPGSTSLKIVAINGVSVTGAVSIQAGDVVTYESAYSLVTGDYQALRLSAFLPLPVLSTDDANADGIPGPVFTPTAVASFPGVGTYKLISPPAGVSILGASTNATSNAITFDFGSRNDTTNTGGQVIRVQYSLTVSSKPFADGLNLASQGQAEFNNANNSLATSLTINQMTLKEPLLATKLGIVGVVNDTGVVKPGNYTVQGSGGTSADPSTTFKPAGSTGSPFTGAPPTSIAGVENLDVRNLDGGDVARFAQTVQNKGTSTSGAYDVTVVGTLPAGFTALDVSNLQVTSGDGTVLGFTKPDGSAATVADYFAGGVKILGAGGSSSVPALYGAGDATHRDILFVTYDLKLPVAQHLGMGLNGTASIVNWSASAGGVSVGNGFVSAGTPLGEPASDITDNAGIGVIAPRLSHFIRTSNAPTEDNKDSAYPNNTVVVGETRPVDVVISLPEGYVTNGAGHVTVTETLAPGVTFSSLTGITLSSGVTETNGPTGTPYSIVGNTVVFDLGTRVTNANVDATGIVTISFNVTVPDNVGTVDGNLFPISAQLNYDGTFQSSNYTTSLGTATSLDAAVTTINLGTSATTGLVSQSPVIYGTGSQQATVTFAGSSGVYHGNAPGVAAPPYTSSGPDTRNYFASEPSGSVTITFASPQKYFGLLWGSIDPGLVNTLSFYRGSVLVTRVTGDDIIGGASGNQGSTGSYYVNINTLNGTSYDRVVVACTTPAFEFNQVAYGPNNSFVDGNAALNVKGGETLIDHEPMVTQTLVDDATGSVRSGQTLTYTVTFKNTGIVDAPDLTETLAISAGLTYVPGSLSSVSGGTSPAVDATNPSALVVKAVSLAPGATAIYTFKATVNNNQASGASETVSSVPASSLYRSIPLATSSTGHIYPLSASTTRTVQSFGSPTMSIVSEAAGTPATAPTQTAPLSIANVVVGDLVRLHGSLQFPEGSNSVVLDFTIPTGLVFENDGTATIALASPNGDTRSSIIDPSGNIAGLQVTEGVTPINPLTYKPLYLVPTAAIDTSVPGHVRINLGTVSNNDALNVPNYIVVELNALVANAASNTNGVGLVTTLTAGVGSASATTSVVEPRVTLTKVVTAVSSGTGTVTYQVTVSNTGTATAYEVSLDDTQGTNEGNISSLTSSGGASALAITSGNGTGALRATMNLAVGATQVFTYTAQVVDTTIPVPDKSATVTYTTVSGNAVSLSGSTAGTSGSATGERTGNLLIATDNLNANAVAGLGRESGRVWRDIGSNRAVYNPTEDLPLAGVTVTVTTAGPDGTFGTSDDIVQTTTTAADGTWSVALLPDGTARVVLSAPGSGGIPSTYTLVYNDGGALTSPASSVNSTAGTQVGPVNFGYLAPDAAPTLAGTTSTRASDVGGPAGGNIPLYVSATAADFELDRIVAAADGSYSGTVLTVQRYNSGSATPNAADTYVGTGAVVLSGGTVTLSGTNVGAYTISNGVLQMTFNGTATSGNIGAVISGIAYHNTDASVFAYGLQFGTTLTDANTLGYQGTGGVMTSNVLASRFVDIAPSSSAFIVPYVEGNNTTVSILPYGSANLQNSSGPDNTFTSAAISVSTGFTIGQDVLSFTGNGSTGNISGAYNAGTGLLTLVSAGGTATAAQWQAALRLVQYQDTSHVPNTSTRGFSASLIDKSTGNTVSSASTTTSFTSTDDSPVLNTGITLTASGGTEDLGALPVGAVGFLVSSIAGRGTGALNITDTDGAGVNNGGSPLTPYGLSIISNDSTQGTWYYSTDNGSTWSSFTVTAGQGLHLLSDASTRLYFRVTTPDFNGVLAQGLSFRAWDTFDGVSNGTLSAMPTTTGEGAPTNSAGAAYSSSVASVAVRVTAVNDAPVASASYVLASVVEDVTSPTGIAVSAMSSAFSDVKDAQFNATTNPFGSKADTLAGIAIIGNSVTSAQGAWQYSSDGGTTWNAIGSGLSDSNALLLGSGTRLRFLPVTYFNGTPGNLTFRLVESGTAIVGTSPYTGDTLQASNTALNGVDVSANGGSTEISANTGSLTITVTAVNDAPVASGTATSAAVEDIIGTGATVSSIMGQGTAFYSDAHDTVTASPDGSTGTPLAGIAIIGNASNAATQGAWQYSLDGGTTWTDVGAASNTSAVVLFTGDLLRFVAVANYNGIPGNLIVRDSDGTGLPAHGPGRDISANVGGTGGFSAGTVVINANVAAVNDAPVGAATAMAAPGTEDIAGAGQTVSTLFTPAFSDTADAQFNATTNPFGSTANTLAGIAVTVNTANAANQGTWQYSMDSGATWNGVGAVSESSALLLPGYALLRFVSVTDFNGVPPGLGVRVIDNSTGSAGSGRTGADVSALAAPVSGVNLVSGNGGGTAVSGSMTVLGITITAVNNAPTTGSPVSISAVEDTLSPVVMVSAILGSSNDAHDNVTTAVSGGSTANPLVGIAVVGNPAPSTVGAWQYSTDGGTTWVGVGTVSESSALILGTSDVLRFLPVANFNGTPPSLVFRAIDGSAGTIGSSSTTGAGLTSNAAFTTDVSGTYQGGANPVSGNTGNIATTLAAVNNAPVFTGTTAIPVTEDATSTAGISAGTLASSLSYSDAVDNVPDSQGGTGGSSSTPLAAVAIVGNTATAAQGSWQFSLDGGTTWTNVGAGLSASNAIVLTLSDRVRFIPSANYNGVTGSLSLMASDGALSGTLVHGTGRDISPYIGNTGGWSAGIATVSAAVAAVNDAPTTLLPAVSAINIPEDTTNAGQTISALFTPAFSDAADAQFNAITNPSGSIANILAGVIVTGNSANALTQGAWQYSTDGGTTWTAVGTVSESSGLLLGAGASLRFAPVANWNGTTPALVTHLVDSSGGDIATTTVTSGIDTTGANSGGITAVSSSTVDARLIVTPVNDAPVTGNTTATPGVEDTAPTVTLVTALLATSNDSKDNISGTAAGTVGSSSADALVGIVITGNSANALTQGTWQYSTDSGVTWTAVGAVSDTAALVLGVGNQVRFLPIANFNGTPGTLTYRAIDGSASSIGNGEVIAATLGGNAAFITDVSGAGQGGTTPVSGNIGIATITIAAVNDAPIFSGAVTASFTEDTTSIGAPVSSYLPGFAYSDAVDTVTSSLDGSTGTPVAAIAIIGNSTTVAQGVWQYSLDAGLTWTSLPSVLGDSSATVLRPSDLLRFIPATNFNGTGGTLTIRANDGAYTSGVGETKDISAGIGNAGGWSGGTGNIASSVVAVNDAPLAGPSASAAAGTEGVIPAGQAASALFGAAFSDTADAQFNASTNPNGSIANTLAGVVITGNSADALTQGAWQYSTDGGTTWTGVGTVSESSGLLLSADASLRFAPGLNFNGTAPALVAHLVDSSGGAVATSTQTRGVDTTGANSGGTTATSSNSTSLTEIVRAVNNAPVAGNTVIPSGVEDITPPGTTVSTLLVSSNDNADNVSGGPGATAGSSGANTLVGIAITGNAATTAQGAWQYSTDNGTTWRNIGAVSDTAALVLGRNDQVRFLSVSSFNGTPGTLTYRAVEADAGNIGSSTTTGNALGGNDAFTTDVSGAYQGGATAVSGNTGIATITIAAVNNAPSFSGTFILPTGTENQVNAGTSLGVVLSGLGYSDALDTVTSSPDGSRGTPPGAVGIVGNPANALTQGVWQYSTDGGTTWNGIGVVSDTSALVLSPLARLRFVSAPDYNGTVPSLILRANDGADTGVLNTLRDISGGIGNAGGWSDGTASAGGTVSAVNSAPVVGAGGQPGVVSIPSGVEDTLDIGVAVGVLLGQPGLGYSDARDTVTSTPDNSGSIGTPASGLAIIGTPSLTGGAWQYSSDNGLTWQAVPLDASDSNALVLGMADRIRFLSAHYFNGDLPPLRARVSDSAPVSLGIGVSIGADVGGTGTWSGTVLSVGGHVNAVNNSPVLDMPNARLSLLESGVVTTTVSGLAALLGYNDSLDTVPDSRGGLNGSVGTPPSALAVVTVGTPPSAGVWYYSIDGGNTFIPLPLAGPSGNPLTVGEAFVLLPTDMLRFVPLPGHNGPTPGLQVEISDTLDSRGFHDVTATLNGHWSGGGSVDLSIVALNDAPVAGGSVTLPAIMESSDPGAGQSVVALFGPGFSDPIDAAKGTGNLFVGIVIVSNVTPVADGSWQYSLDGMTWTAVPVVSGADGFVLGADVRLRFQSVFDWNGVPDPLVTRVVEASDGEFTSGRTGASLGRNEAVLSPAISYGGRTSVSENTTSLVTSVLAVNSSPDVSGTYVLRTAENTTTPVTAAAILASSGILYSDIRDSVPDALTHGGSFGTPASALAIIYNPVAPSQGSWQYSLDAGTTWTDVPQDLSPSHALVLLGNDSLRFVPARNFIGQPSALLASISDGSIPLAHGISDISQRVGGAGDFSRNVVTVGATVDGTVTPTVTQVQEIPPVVQVVQEIPPVVQVVQEIPPVVQVVQEIPPVVQVVQEIPPVVQVVQVSPGPVRVTPETFGMVFGRRGMAWYDDMPTSWLIGSSAYRFVVTQENAIIDLPSNTFVDSDPGARLSYEAKMSDGRPLPTWLTFNTKTLTFTGIPPTGEYGALDIEVFAMDGQQNKAMSEVHVFVGRKPSDLRKMVEGISFPVGGFSASPVMRGNAANIRAYMGRTVSRSVDFARGKMQGDVKPSLPVTSRDTLAKVPNREFSQTRTLNTDRTDQDIKPPVRDGLTEQFRSRGAAGRMSLIRDRLRNLRGDK